MLIAIGLSFVFNLCIILYLFYVSSWTKGYWFLIVLQNVYLNEFWVSKEKKFVEKYQVNSRFWICFIRLWRWDMNRWNQGSPRPYCTGLGFEHWGALWYPPKILNAENAQLVGKLVWAKKNCPSIPSHMNIVLSASLWGLYHPCCYSTDWETEAKKTT